MWYISVSCSIYLIKNIILLDRFKTLIIMRKVEMLTRFSVALLVYVKLINFDYAWIFLLSSGHPVYVKTSETATTLSKSLLQPLMYRKCKQEWQMLEAFLLIPPPTYTTHRQIRLGQILEQSSDRLVFRQNPWGECRGRQPIPTCSTPHPHPLILVGFICTTLPVAVSRSL